VLWCSALQCGGLASGEFCREVTACGRGGAIKTAYFVASSWFFYLHYVYDARSHEHRIIVYFKRRQVLEEFFQDLLSHEDDKLNSDKPLAEDSGHPVEFKVH
jgi:hypothetical protein